MLEFKILKQKPGESFSDAKTLLQKITQRLKAILPHANNTTPKRGTITTDAEGVKTFTFADMDIEFILSNEEIQNDAKKVAEYKADAELQIARIDELTADLAKRREVYALIVPAMEAAQNRLDATVTAIGKL